MQGGSLNQTSNKEFEIEVRKNIERQGENEELKKASIDWIRQSGKYSYNFSWLGRPIIQYPQDIIALQEIIWRVKPDLIIETGIAHGGSVILSASLLELNAFCGGPKDAFVMGIDIDIREHNRLAIESHPMSKRIKMLQGSSIDTKIVQLVKDLAADKKAILVILDSNHTHEHVLNELLAYAPLVSVGSYCVVLDTVIEDMPDGSYSDRPWGIGNNPKTAVYEFISKNNNFEIDKSIQNKLLITVALDGYLIRNS